MAQPRKSRAAEPLPDIALITVTLHRATGRVEYDDEFSTPVETWSALSIACARASDKVDQINELPTEDAP